MARKNDTPPVKPPTPPTPPVIDQGGYNLGDVVVLKSGGVAMTIEEFAVGSGFGRGQVDDENASRTSVLCSWFRPDGTSESQHFYVSSIMPFAPAPAKASEEDPGL